MNSSIKLSKSGVIVATLIATTTLIGACSTTKTENQTSADRGSAKNLSPAERKKFAAQRKANFKTMKQACDNQAHGTRVGIKINDKTIDGTCTLSFKPDQRLDRARGGMRHQAPGADRPRQRAHGEYHQNKKHMKGKRRDYKENYATLKRACDNQSVGSKVSVKLNDKTITGTCEVRFKPDHKRGRGKGAHMRNA